MIDQRIINDLYDSGIVFDVCCVYGGGFRVRLGSPMTGFSAGVVVDTHAAVVEQLWRWQLGNTRREERPEPPLVPNDIGSGATLVE